MARELPTGTVTLLFSDIEGSTRLQLRLGPRYAGVLSQHRALLRAAFADHGGIEVSTEGDGSFVVFPSARGAVRAAVEAQCALRAHTWDADAVPRVRMGLHTGEVNVVEDDYVGHTIHEAARIAASAHGGQVVISESTAALVTGSLGSDVSLLDLGDHSFKDLDRSYRVFQVRHPALDEEHPPLRTAGGTRHNLPRSATRFVGREDDLIALAKAVGGERIVTLTGPGGAGKTRLATEVARTVLPEFPGGVWFAELAGVGAGAVASAVARAIGLHDAAGTDIAAGIAGHFAAARDTLLVLDNCEHVLDEAANLVSQLAAATASLTMLATSREPLDIAGEQLWMVEPLELPPADATYADMSDYEAVHLFVDRAALSRSDFRLTPENFHLVATICQRLDGLPLGVELAAARLRSLTIDDLCNRLDDALSLATGRRRTSGRHSTLRAAIGWSHDLLPPAEQAVLARLSVFRNGFDLSAAEAVVADAGHGPVRPSDVLELVSRLVEKSLVVLEDGPSTRYRLLETIREFAAERLVERGKQEETRQRHLRWFCNFARRERDQMFTAHATAATIAVRDDHENLRAAIEWALTTDISAAAQLVRDLARFWALTGLGGEGAQLAARVLAALPAGHPGRADTLYALGVSLYAAGGQLDQARRVIEDGLAAGPEETLRAALLHVLGNIQARLENPDLARSLWDDSLVIRQRLGDSVGVMILLHNRAQLLSGTDRAAAVDAYEEVIRFAEDRGLTWMVGVPLINMAVVRREKGDFAAAATYYGRALDASRAAHDSATETAAHCGLGWLAATTGDIEEASHRFDVVARRGIEHDQPEWRRLAAEGRAAVAVILGDIDSAERHAAAALGLATASDAADPLSCLAIVARERGEADNVDRLLEDALAVASDSDRPAILILAAESAVRRDDAEEAMTRLGSIGTPVEDLPVWDQVAWWACRAEIARARAEHDAEHTCRAAATRAGDLGFRYDEAAALRALAGVLVDLGRLRDASTVFATEKAVRGGLVPVPPSYAATYERDLAAVRGAG